MYARTCIGHDGVHHSHDGHERREYHDPAPEDGQWAPLLLLRQPTQGPHARVKKAGAAYDRQDEDDGRAEIDCSGAELQHHGLGVCGLGGSK